MHTGLEERADGPPRMAAFYSERARHSVGLIITGGVGISEESLSIAGGLLIATPEDVATHRMITDAVHSEGGQVAIQLLHVGRYSKEPTVVAPSAVRSPISPFEPRELTAEEVERTLDDYVLSSTLSVEAGYDAIEIMGSEGYLIPQFLSARTNLRTDEWGGAFSNRMRFPLELVRRVRAKVGAEYPIIFRMSVLDLVPDGLTGAEVTEFARALQDAGVTAINSGIGWHESRVPTIATSVPRAAFTSATARVAAAVDIPVIASNRINDPQVAEDILAAGDADLISMARPLLADPSFVTKAAAGRPESINTCIACNQACLDHTFTGRVTSCLVNPRACHETELVLAPTRRRRRIAVIGAGPSGLAFATAAAECGHDVVLYEENLEIGGQFTLASRIPGKEEFAQTLRYYSVRLADLGVELRLGFRATAATLASGGFDDIVIATGVEPRIPQIDGVDHPNVATYAEVLNGVVQLGERIVIIGAGGIGVDIAEYVSHAPTSDPGLDQFFRRWGIDARISSPGGLMQAKPVRSTRHVTILQRRSGKVGAGLNPTTGWIHRAELAIAGVEQLSEVIYRRIDDEGVHISQNGVDSVIAADTVILCAGQNSRDELFEELQSAGLTPHIIGGARVAAELDAKRAINEAVRLAAAL